MKIENFISKRYFSIKRKSSFTSLISSISIVGIVLGVAALIIIMSVMNGFEREVRQRILGITGHLSVRTYNSLYINNYDSLISVVKGYYPNEIAGASPVISSKGGISYNGVQDGVMIKAVYPAYDSNVGDWSKHIIRGCYGLADTLTKDGYTRPGVVLGKYVADRLGALVGDEIVLVSFAQTTEGGSSMMPKLKKFVVRGVFETGMYDYDANMAYISIDNAYKLFDIEKGDVNYIQFKLNDYNKAKTIGDSLSLKLDYPYYALDWETQNKTIFKWMKLEKIVMFLALSLIILVAAFNIISSLVMLVMEKTRDIGVLRTLGLTKNQISRIFMFNGLYIGIIGTVIGTLIGLAVGYSQMKYQWIKIPGDVYFINKLPIYFRATDIILVDVSGLIICLLASIYPAKRASKLDVVEAVHYE